MTRTILGAVLIGSCLLQPASAFAGVPDPVHCTVPAYIKVGGAQTTAGVPDPSIAFTVIVRDFANNPVAGSSVAIDFANCTDTRLCTAVIAGQVVDCSGSNKKVSATTNASGQASLSILGAATNAGTTPPQAGGHPGAGANCIQVRADAVVLGNATAIVYDQNGAIVGGNGVTPLDFAFLLQDTAARGLNRAPYRGRSDINGDGRLSPLDWHFMKTIVGASALGSGSGAGCAGAPGGVPQPYCPN